MVSTSRFAEITEARYGVQTAATNPVTIQDCDFDGNDLAGVRVTAGTPLIEGGRITGSINGVQVASGSPTVRDMVIHDTTSDGVYVTTTGSVVVTLDQLTIDSVSGSGVLLTTFFGSPQVVLTNSIVTNASNYGVRRTNNGSITVSSSLVWGNNTANTSGTSGSILVANPLYSNPPTDYALTSNSPARFQAIGGGDLGALPFDGTPTPDLLGTLWTDTTLAAGVHTVPGDLTVAPGVTLTINPGATLEAATNDQMEANLDTNRVELRVEGTIFALGTPTTPVVFESAGTTAGSWYGINLLSTANTSTLQNAQVTEANYGLRTQASANNAITDVDFFGNETAGIRVQAGSPTITGGSIRDGLFGVEVVNSGSPSISDVTIVGTTNYGIYVTATSGTSTVDHATIHDCGVGVLMSTFSGSPSLTMTNSIVTGNGSYGLRRSNNGSVTVSDSLVWDNSPNTSGVTAFGNQAENPLYVSAPTDFALTEYSPARFAASDGTDLGANPYAGASTVGLRGTLWGGTVLDAPGSPYTVTGDLRVPSGTTLTIEAGVEVRFETTDTMQGNQSASQIELIVQGDLDVAGTLFEPVTFQSTGTATNSWYGVRLRPASTATMTNLEISEAEIAITSDTSGAVALDRVRVSHGSGAGLLVPSGTPVVDTLFATDVQYGVNLTGSGSITLTNGVIWDTTNSRRLQVSSTSSCECVDHPLHDHPFSANGSGVLLTRPSSGFPTAHGDSEQHVVTSNLSLGSSAGERTARIVGVGTATRGTTAAVELLGHVVTGAWATCRSNPFYVDASLGNFRLGATSPAHRRGDRQPTHPPSTRRASLEARRRQRHSAVPSSTSAPTSTVRSWPASTVSPSGTVVLDEIGTSDDAQRGSGGRSRSPTSPSLVSVDDSSEATVSPGNPAASPRPTGTYRRPFTVTGLDDDLDDGRPIAWTVTLDACRAVSTSSTRCSPPSCPSPGTTIDDDAVGFAVVGANLVDDRARAAADSFTDRSRPPSRPPTCGSTSPAPTSTRVS